MLDFKPIEPSDRDLFMDFYTDKPSQTADNSFANLCCYSFLYKGEYCVEDNVLLTRIHFDYMKQVCYYMPIGSTQPKPFIEQIIIDSEQKGYQLNFVVENPRQLEEMFPSKFDITANRNLFDYLYLRSDLAELKGKKFQPKRNHVNQFNNRYQYKFVVLQKQDKQRCMQMLETWRRQEMDITPEFKRDYDDEKYVIEYLFDNFEPLGIWGGGIETDGKLIAFSLGSRINRNTFDTHIEKADRNYLGAYSVINKEMALHMPDDYIYINREEDKGIMGLRQAKMSYHPYQIIEKYIAKYKR
ncbi:MAG: DUF2156 domain-containing protein [Bacteroidales bacterium]|nr:DUF2156 domain-containing protein [Bacteroidales bacterium]